jgi:hypothetical protein
MGMRQSAMNVAGFTAEQRWALSYFLRACLFGNIFGLGRSSVAPKKPPSDDGGRRSGPNLCHVDGEGRYG